MSLANSNRASITAWLSCEAYERKVIHGQHSWIHKSELVWCCGFDATKDVVDPEPSHTLTGLSEADLGLLAEALATHRDAAPIGMDYRHVDTLRAKIVDAWIWYA